MPTRILATGAVVLVIMAESCPSVRGQCTEPQYGWTHTIGGPEVDDSERIAVGPDGGIYVAGRFTGTVDLDPTAGVDMKTSSEFRGDMFLLKLGNDGSYEWTHVWPRGFAEDVAVTADGAVYLTGGFIAPSDGVTDLDPTDGVDIHSGWGLFVIKLLSDGSFVWAKTLAVEGRVIALAANTSGVVLTGQLEGSGDFDPGPEVDSFTKVGADDIFVTRLLTDGSYDWTKIVGGPNAALHELGTGVAIDDDDSIAVVGTFFDTVDFDPGEGVDLRSSNGHEDVFVLKLQVDGTYDWVSTSGSAVLEPDYLGGVVFDSFGNVVVTGRQGVSRFVRRLAPNGSTDWTTPGPGGSGIAVDDDDNILAVGFAGGNSKVCKLDTSGAVSWCRTLSGTSSVTAYDIGVDGDGNPIFAGQFYETVDFDPSQGLDVHESNGSEDVFVSKLMAISLPPVIVESDPPHGAIDARQDFSLSGSTRQGIDTIWISFLCGVADADADTPATEQSFLIEDTAGTPPIVLSALTTDGKNFELVLSDPITPGAWTTVVANVTNFDGVPIENGRITIGYLPGDVTGNGLSNPGADILALIDSINGVEGRVLPEYSTDINRSRITTPQDILRLIDLFNGANSSRSWVAGTLPDFPG